MQSTNKSDLLQAPAPLSIDGMVTAWQIFSCNDVQGVKKSSLDSNERRFELQTPQFKFVLDRKRVSKSLCEIHEGIKQPVRIKSGHFHESLKHEEGQKLRLLEIIHLS